MPRTARTIASLLLLSALAHGAIAAGDPPEEQPLIAVLQESKEKGRGVTLYIRGATVSAVVLGVESGFVVARNQQSSRIVVRLSSIDAAVSAF